MAQITIKIDTEQVKRAVGAIQGFSPRRMNAAIATALTRTAKKTQEGVRKAMPSYIDRPTPYTMRGIFMKPANANNMQARVWYGDEFKGNQVPQARYLYPQVHGGGRSVKRFEKALQAKGSMPPGTFAVPTKNVRLDQYGNISAGQLKQIISQAGTELMAGYQNTISNDKRKRLRAYNKAGGQYVAVPKQKGKLNPGIYLATGRSFGRTWGYGRTGKLVPMLMFKSSLSYKQRFPFYELAEGYVRDNINAELKISIDDHIARVMAKKTSP